ncbi:hypothetical protein Hanom_Chr01g00052571 [Helianthus anomalus]
MLGLWGPTIFGLVACFTTPVTCSPTLPDVMIATLVTSWLLPCIRALTLATSLALVDRRRLANAAVALS